MRIFFIVGTIFSGIGALFLALGIFFYVDSQRFTTESVPTQGVVVDTILSTSTETSGRRTEVSYPVVRFGTAEGDTLVFKSGTGRYPPKYRVGDVVAVRYRPESPGKARIDDASSLLMLPLIFGGMGGLFFVMGWVFILVNLRQRRIREKLKVDGIDVSAEIIGVERDPGITKNGVHPFRIQAQWQHPETQAIPLFRSDPIWFDPKRFIHQSHVAVKVDMDKPSRHLMDLSFLPQSGE